MQKNKLTAAVIAAAPFGVAKTVAAVTGSLAVAVVGALVGALAATTHPASLAHAVSRGTHMRAVPVRSYTLGFLGLAAAVSTAAPIRITGTRSIALALALAAAIARTRGLAVAQVALPAGLALAHYRIANVAAIAIDTRLRCGRRAQTLA